MSLAFVVSADPLFPAPSSLWYDIPKRPTRDSDWLGYGPDDIDSMVAVFQDICRFASDDGIEFDPMQVKGNEIRKNAGYGGVRIEILAKLDGARLTLQADICFGDAVTPAPELIQSGAVGRLAGTLAAGLSQVHRGRREVSDRPRQAAGL